MLQCVAVCCSVLQCAAVCCSVLQRETRETLQCLAACCSVLQCVAVCCNVLLCVAVCCSVLKVRLERLPASKPPATRCFNSVCAAVVVSRVFVTRFCVDSQALEASQGGGEGRL